jgi:hypothetical protein
MTLSPALTIILPVFNAEDRLSRQVAQLLEILPELDCRFEIVLVDDASTDDSAMLAKDLARSYPQVRALRHPVRLGLAETIQTGLDHTTGEIVLVGDEQQGVPAADLAALWQMRDEADMVLARKRLDASLAEQSVSWVRRLLAWQPSGAARTSASRGTAAKSSAMAAVHVLRRGQLESLVASELPPDERSLAQAQWRLDEADPKLRRKPTTNQRAPR